VYAQCCIPGNRITQAIARELPGVYASDSIVEAKIELMNLKSELSQIAIFDKKGKCIGGKLHKLRQ
jgi:hypothetical protein